MDKDREGKVAEMLKKVMNTGLGAAFMTEEAVKNIFSELSLPKDIMGPLLQGAKSTKEEFVKAVQDGVADYLKNVDLQEELQKVLTNFDVEVKAKVSFHPKKDARKEGREKKDSRSGGDGPSSED